MARYEELNKSRAILEAGRRSIGVVRSEHATRRAIPLPTVRPLNGHYRTRNNPGGSPPIHSKCGLYLFLRRFNMLWFYKSTVATYRERDLIMISLKSNRYRYFPILRF